MAEGETANQQIINSTVNVVAGDQIHGNKVVHYVIGSNSEARPADHSESVVLFHITGENPAVEIKQLLLLKVPEFLDSSYTDIRTTTHVSDNRR